MLNELSYVARSAIKDYCSSHDLLELYEAACTDPQNCAWLYFILRAAEDYSDYFPRGKWATLQRLEQVLDTCSVAEVDRLNAPRKATT